MASKRKTMPVWLITNAWREIFARIFDGVETKLNVSPAWLVNPTTNRRLKLDLFYPEIGVAVRFEGLQGKQRRQRPSLEEEIQQHTRDNARVTMCRANGVELIVVDTLDDNPYPVFQAIDVSLGRAKQVVQSKKLLDWIKQARTKASSIARRVRDSQDLKLYADLWEDRHYKMVESNQTSLAPRSKISLTEGMEVEHTKFGPGVVLTVAPGENDTLVTIDFITAGQKTLAASLVGDKLIPR